MQNMDDIDCSEMVAGAGDKCSRGGSDPDGIFILMLKHEEEKGRQKMTLLPVDVEYILVTGAGGKSEDGR